MLVVKIKIFVIEIEVDNYSKVILIVSNGIRKYRDSIVGTRDAIGSILGSNYMK